MTPHELAVREERLAAARVRAAAKASRARSKQHAREVWAQVKRHPHYPRCSCGLRPGMDAGALLELGAGCAPGGRYICPVLDKYRRLV